MTRRKNFIVSVILVVFSIICFLSGVGSICVQYILKAKETVNEDYVPSKALERVLYISSYDPGYVISSLQAAGIKDRFAKNHVLFETFYMDMKNYDDEENFNLFYLTVKHKLSTIRPFDAVIVSDDNALIFAETYQEELFKNTPIVFFGINDIAHGEEAARNPWMTGAAEDVFVYETMEAAIEQNPEIGCLVGIFDNTITGRGDRKQFETCIKNYPNLQFRSINISNLKPMELAFQLISVPKDSVIICTSTLQDYAHANGFSTYEIVEFIEKHSLGIPIYRTNAVGIGAGFVGGKIFDYYKSAYNAADTVIRVLDGEDISTIPFTVDHEGKYCFDWAVIKSLGLSTKTLPDGVEYINRPVSFLETNKQILLPFFLIFVAMLCVLIVSIASWNKTKHINGVMMIMNKRIRQTNKELIDSKTKITFVANNDRLTELPNRAHGVEEIHHIMESGVPFSLFLMDIDDFKNYNDTYTHACGDFVLQEYGRRLASLTVNNEYFAARYGGDEFIIVHKCGHIDRNGKELEKLHNLLNAPIQYNNMKLDLKATLGYADSDPDITFDELVTNADIAMYEAKKKGKGTIVAFVSDMKESILKKNRIIEILKDECSKEGFEIRYQPQVNVTTGDVYGFEALVRLADYSIGPGDFIPVAEDGGFITQIGRIVTEKVISQMAKWRDQGMELKKVAINYSNGQLVDDEYVNYLKSLINRYGISPSLIEIEITESLFMAKQERAFKLFQDLSEIGVGLALDDFGTGYSSLSYLTFIPAGKVKIDKTIVDNYLVDGKESFIENIVHLVHDLGMKLTVEGVEQKWQYDKLQKMKCDYIQGYFFSKPMLADAVPDFTVIL